MGSRPSAIATLVQRTSRFTVLLALPDGIKAEQVTPRLTQFLLRLPASMRRALTWDGGREIAGHQAITAATKMPIYLCKPRSPWQRGTNENTNRLPRQYLPKSTDLCRFDQADLDAIASELNHRPRRIPGYRSPAEVYAERLNSGDALTLETAIPQGSEPDLPGRSTCIGIVRTRSTVSTTVPARTR
jgi:IS30 family transposase